MTALRDFERRPGDADAHLPGGRAGGAARRGSAGEGAAGAAGEGAGQLADDHIVSCDIQANGKKVAELFDKYNLRALPVVDAEKKIAGVIYAEQVIAQLRTII